MVIFLLWLGFVCCSVANGIIYDHVSTPERYYYMVIPSIIAIVLIIIHRVYTQNWCNKNKKNKKKCEVSHHFQVFGLSAMFSAAMFMSALLCVQTDETSWGFFIGSVSAFVSFCFATSRESSYI
jgi:hypothetical protein